MTHGKIYLIPNTLGGESTKDIIPQEVADLATSLRAFAVEDVKSARRLLRKIDREFPIDDCQFFELNKRTPIEELHKILRVLSDETSIGVISEAGCPGVADPGAELVALAQQRKIQVVPLVGPSSILLALMGSGFSGQNFAFHGYLPKERKDRIKKLKDFEGDSRRNGTTHIFMDTPFRNMNVLDDLLNELADPTMVCIASNITLPDASIKTMSVKNWREEAYDLAKIPTMFLIGTSQV
ncbi:MAG: SAM-dependent methyltransferase [Crocinitomicaceae bacterium]|nr:SAM-dependent methyltransferase [Crocinitomicaceae bacterium]